MCGEAGGRLQLELNSLHSVAVSSASSLSGEDHIEGMFSNVLSVLRTTVLYNKTILNWMKRVETFPSTNNMTEDSVGLTLCPMNGSKVKFRNFNL